MSASALWWTPADQKAVDRWRAWEVQACRELGRNMAAERRGELALEAAMPPVGCRHCAYWESADGAVGACRGPELECGRTSAGQLCEQWEAP